MKLDAKIIASIALVGTLFLFGGALAKAFRLPSPIMELRGNNMSIRSFDRPYRGPVIIEYRGSQKTVKTHDR